MFKINGLAFKNVINKKSSFYNANKIFRYFTSSIKKNDVFTISLIGRPNVGKSTLFNKLLGENKALVDNTPGLTRDRKEGEFKMFGVKIRVVDTAGVEDFEESKKYEEILNKTIEQTRKALIYSDLALFLIDSRKGITFTDIKLANWINKIRKMQEESEAFKKKEEEEKVEIKINEEDNEKDKEGNEDMDNINEAVSEEKSGELSVINDFSNNRSIRKAKSSRNNDRKTEREKFYEKLKELKETDEIKIPPVKLIANKTENDFVPDDVYCDFIKLKLGEPLLISAEHGDNMTDLFALINDSIPEAFKEKYDDIIEKRLKRFEDYRTKMRSEFVEFIQTLPESERNKYDLNIWEKDFEFLNKFDPEENSDFDSDNEIDPSDSIKTNNSEVPDVKNSKSLKDHFANNNRIRLMKRPIKIAVVGKQNVGKSSLVNTLLKENRVVISDIPGTTRDSIPIEWIYKGKRVILTDTAGLLAKSKVREKIDKLASAQTIKAINDSHVILYVVDSMNSFTPVDMKIIDYIGKQGRAIIFISNKWDLVGNGFKIKAKKWIEDQLEKGCSHYKSTKIHFTSAKSFYKVDNIMDEVLNAYNSWNKRITTNQLNQWLNQIKKVSSMPSQKGESLKIKFITQLKIRPPCFSVFVNDIGLFFKAHETFIKKMLIKEFRLRNTAIRFILRDHEKIIEINKFKKVSEGTAKIQKKVELLKEKLKNPTYRRRAKGADFLYGRKSLYWGNRK